MTQVIPPRLIFLNLRKPVHHFQKEVVIPIITHAGNLAGAGHSPTRLAPELVNGAWWNAPTVARLQPHLRMQFELVRDAIDLHQERFIRRRVIWLVAPS